MLQRVSLWLIDKKNTKGKEISIYAFLIFQETTTIIIEVNFFLVIKCNKNENKCRLGLLKQKKTFSQTTNNIKL